MSPQRDKVLERGMLLTAEHMGWRRISSVGAGPLAGAWTTRVMERVDQHGETVCRDLPDHLSVRQILEELREECLDLGGWSIMAVQVAQAQGMSPEAVQRLRRELERVASLGALGDVMLRRALAELAS